MTSVSLGLAGVASYDCLLLGVQRKIIKHYKPGLKFPALCSSFQLCQISDSGCIPT